MIKKSFNTSQHEINKIMQFKASSFVYGGNDLWNTKSDMSKSH